MKTFPILKTVAIALTLVGLSGITYAQQGAPKNSDRMEKKREFRQQNNRMAAIPDLTDQQKQQIRELMLETRKEMLPLQNQMREKAARLKTLRTAENADINAINTMVEEISGIRAEMMKTRLASEQEIRALLTEDQRVVFDSRRQMHMKRKHGERAFRMRSGK
jgi:Spy/CpxP family protein refolding chaperone